VGTATELTIRGKRIFPLVTGTFGGLDFVISVLGEAGDHVASSEVDEVNTALYDAVLQNKRGMGPGSLGSLTDALGKIPGTGDFVNQARELQAESDAQMGTLDRAMAADTTFGFSSSRGLGDEPDSFVMGTRADVAAGTSSGGVNIPAPGIPGLKVDPQEMLKKIYPILVFQ
jgi:hypothetical protein